MQAAAARRLPDAVGAAACPLADHRIALDWPVPATTKGGDPVSHPRVGGRHLRFGRVTSHRLRNRPPGGLPLVSRGKPAGLAAMARKRRRGDLVSGLARKPQTIKATSNRHFL